MRIRRLNTDDVSRYRELMLFAYEHTTDSFTSTREERAGYPDDWWLSRVADPDRMGVALGAFEGETLVGTVALTFSSRPKTLHNAHLIAMYVLPEYRRTGVAMGLVRAALDTCRKRGTIRSIKLTVTQGNESAFRLYQKAGFRVFGTEPMAIRTANGFKAKVQMWLDLHDLDSRK